MTPYRWACLTCDAAGETTATKTGIDDATRHGAKTGHSTATATRAEALARITARVKGAAA